MLKYILLENDSILIEGRRLYRIKALRDIEIPLKLNNYTKKIKKGALGGYIASYNNLSQEDNSWVYEGAMVYDNARVMNNSVVESASIICGNAVVSSTVFTKSLRSPHLGAVIRDYAEVVDSYIGVKAIVGGRAKVYNTIICTYTDYLKVYANSKVSNSNIRAKGDIYGNAEINQCVITGNIDISGNARAYNSKLSSVILSSNENIMNSK